MKPSVVVLLYQENHILQQETQEYEIYILFCGK
jgi:hypothetical protein